MSESLTQVLTLRLLKKFEKGDRVWINGRWVPWPSTPDGAALKAYQCSAGKWTIAFGVRWHPDGRLVREGDTITPDQVMPYTLAALARVDADLDKVITIKLAPHQRAALRSWVFNLGIRALRDTATARSQLLPKINAGKWREAAEQFSLFVYATTSKRRAEDGIAYPWKKAEFGLFIRRSYEQCIFMGWDPTYACDDTRLSLPTRADWQPDWVDPYTKKVGRYYDVILDGKTPFTNIERDAKNHPLTGEEDIFLFESTQDDASVNVEAVGGDAHSTAQISEASAGDRDPVEAVRPDERQTALTQPSARQAPADSGSSQQNKVPAQVELDGSVRAGQEGAAVAVNQPDRAPPPKPLPLPKRPAPPPPPSVQVSNMGWEGLKDMMTSKRFYGGVLIIFGRVVIAMNLGGLAAPGVVGALIGDGILMDWTTGIIANMAGEAIKHWGEKDAKAPLGTAKEVALATVPKVAA